MNLYNEEENAALGEEWVRLVDQWPNCDQERAIELQMAFDNFTAAGGWDDPAVKKWKPRDGLIYVIKHDPQRRQRFEEARQQVEREAAARARNR